MTTLIKHLEWLALMGVMTFMLVGFTGCASTPEQQEHQTRSIVKLAVLGAVGSDVDQAQDILAAVQRVRSDIEEVQNAPPVAVDTLGEALKEQLSWDNMTPLERQALGDTIDGVMLALNQHVTGGTLNPGDHVESYKVLQWIEEAAQLVVDTYANHDSNTPVQQE